MGKKSASGKSESQVKSDKNRTTGREAPNSPPARAQRGVVVTVTQDAMNHSQTIAKQLQKNGMMIESSLDLLGQFIGKASKSQMKAIASIEGVTSVDELGSVHLPPSPDEPQ